MHLHFLLLITTTTTFRRSSAYLPQSLLFFSFCQIRQGFTFFFFFVCFSRAHFSSQQSLIILLERKYMYIYMYMCIFFVFRSYHTEHMHIKNPWPTSAFTFRFFKNRFFPLSITDLKKRGRRSEVGRKKKETE